LSISTAGETDVTTETALTGGEVGAESMGRPTPITMVLYEVTFNSSGVVSQLTPINPVAGGVVKPNTHYAIQVIYRVDTVSPIPTGEDIRLSFSAGVPLDPPYSPTSSHYRFGNAAPSTTRLYCGTVRFQILTQNTPFPSPLVVTVTPSGGTPTLSMTYGFCLNDGSQCF
jgi:hypothetical protein